MNHDKLSQRIFGNELKYVQEVLASEFRSSKGSVFMRRLEEEFSKKFDSKYAVTFCNGTATMHAVLEAHGIQNGDEVIVPPLTMSATTFAVLQANATPVFADVDANSFNIDPLSIESKITEKTKAIITVALFGLSPEMDPIMQIAKKHGLLVIEDNAQCFLGTYKGRIAGSIGNAASFSFQSSKHITSGEGGIIITNDAELAEKTRRVSSLGYAGVGANKGKITRRDIQDPTYSRHVSLGWNYRMSELCAAVALAQIENIKDLVQRRIDVANLFHSVVKECAWLKPQATYAHITNSYWAYALVLDHPHLTWYEFRDRFSSLGGDGIYSAWKLTYLEPMFTDRSFLNREKFISEKNKSSYKKGLCPVAESLQPKLLQFKTNYWDWNLALKQVEILDKTIKSLN